MLTIRLNRVGKKNRAQFRMVVQEHTIAPGGRHVDVLGGYDPHTKKAVLKGDKIKNWLAKGVQVSDSAYNLLVKEGVVDGKKRAIKMERPKKEEIVQEAAPVGEAVAQEVKAEETPKAEEKVEASTEAQAETPAA